MSTIQPKGENIRQAIRWIGDIHVGDDTKTYYDLIGEAAQRFNLSPKEEEFLRGFYKQEGTAQGE